MFKIHLKIGYSVIYLSAGLTHESVENVNFKC